MLPISFAGAQNMLLARKYVFSLFHHSLLEHSKNKVIFWRNVKEILVHFHHSLLRLHGQRVEEYRTVVEAVDPYSFIDFLVIWATIFFLC